MAFFSKIVELLGGGIGLKITDKVLAQFRDKLSEGDRAELQKAILEATQVHEQRLLVITNKKRCSIRDCEISKGQRVTCSDLGYWTALWWSYVDCKDRFEAIRYFI